MPYLDRISVPGSHFCTKQIISDLDDVKEKDHQTVITKSAWKCVLAVNHTLYLSESWCM